MNNLYLLLALGTGAGVAVMTVFNARLGGLLGGPFWAAVAQFSVALSTVLLVAFATRQPAPITTGLHGAPWWIWTGGMFSATFIVVSTFLAPRLGVAVTLATILVGQLSAALVVGSLRTVRRTRRACVARASGRRRVAARRDHAHAVEVMLRESQRRLLTELRNALVPLHRTLLEWERAAYERIHGRTGAAELLKVIVEDPQFAWLRPVSELIARIDEVLQTDAPDVRVDVDGIVSQARVLIVPDEEGTPYARRYHAALQEVPDVVFAHRRVTAVLRDAPHGTLH